MSDVFISYSRRDSDFVRRLHSALESNGRDAWVDWEGIPLTADWWREICAGIEGADTFVFIISPDALTSPICTLEIAHAIQHHKRLIPVVRIPVDEKSAFATLATRQLDDNTRKTLEGRDLIAVARDNWNTLARHNWLFFSDDAAFNDGVEKLVSAIETDLDHVREHTRLLVRTLEWDKRGRAVSGLLSGDQISEAEAWLARGVNKDPAPTPLIAEFIRASRLNANRRQRSLITGISVALVVTLILAALAGVFGVDARNQGQIAQTNAEAADQNYRTALAAQETAVFEENRANENAATAQSAAQIAENNRVTAVAAGSTAVFERERADENADIARTAQLEAENNYATAVAAEGTAVAERDRAEFNYRQSLSRQLAAQSRALLPESLDLALLLALEGYRTSDTFEGKSSLLTALEFAPQIAGFWRGHADRVTVIAVSPDGRRVVSGDAEGYLRLWDAQTGQLIGLPIPTEILPLGIGFTADSSQFRVVEGNGAFVTRDAETGRYIGQSREPITDVLKLLDLDFKASFSADARYVALVTAQNGFSLWDFERGEQIIELRPPDLEMAAAPSTIALHPQGTYAALAYEDTVTIWNAAGEEIDTLAAKFAYLVFSNDGRYLIYTDSLGDDQPRAIVAHVYDLELRRKVKVLTVLEESRRTAESAALSGDGNTLYVGTNGGEVIGIDVNTGERVIRDTRVHSGDTLALATTWDGGQVYAGGADKAVVHIQRAQSSQIGQRKVQACETGASSAAYSADSRLLALDCGETVQLIDAVTGAPLFSPIPAGLLWDMVFHPQRPLLALATTQGRIIFVEVDAAGWREVLAADAPDAAWVRFTGDGRRAYSGNRDDTLYFWDIDANWAYREQRLTPPTDGGVPLSSFAWSAGISPDGRTLATGALIGTYALLWDIDAEGQIAAAPRSRLETPTEFDTSPLFGLAFSPDGQKLAGSLIIGPVLVWDVTTGRLAREPIIPAQTAVSSVVQFSPDGALLAVGLRGSTVLYETTAFQQIGPALTAADLLDITDLAFSPDGRELVTTHQNAVITWATADDVWAERACARANRPLTEAEWLRFVAGENAAGLPYGVTCPNALLTQADEWALSGQQDANAVLLEQAEAAFTTLALDTVLPDNADFQTAVCLLGALDNFAAVVLPSCERMVELAPDSPSAYDARGIARTFTGDLQGAADDFRKYIELAQGEAEPERIAQREAWITTINEGQNPFVSQVRLALRHEYRTRFGLLAAVAELPRLPFETERPDDALTAEQVTAAVAEAGLSFTPIAPPTIDLPGWYISRARSFDRLLLENLADYLVPGQEAFVYGLTRESDEVAVQFAQSNGPYASVREWSENLGFLTLFGSLEWLEIAGVEVLKLPGDEPDELEHYFFIVDTVHVWIIVDPTQIDDETVNLLIETVLTAR